jgi:hypothetical protein
MIKEWQFFLESKDTSNLIPVTARNCHLDLGCYRILAQTYLTHTPIEIRLDYQTKEGEKLCQKYLRVTPIDGWLIITPFLDLTEGNLQLRCQADVLAELSGNYWEKYLNLKIITPKEFSSSNQQQPYCELILNEQNLIQSTWSQLSLSGTIDLLTTNLSQAAITYELYNPKSGTRLLQKQQDLDLDYLPGIFTINLEFNPHWNTYLILGQVHLDVIYYELSLRTSQCFKIIANPAQLWQRFKQLHYQLEPLNYTQLKLIDFKTKKPIELPDLTKNSTSNHLQKDFAALELNKRFWLRLNQLANSE